MGNNNSSYQSAGESSYSSCSWANPFCSQTSHSYNFEGDGTLPGNSYSSFGSINGPMAIVMGSMCLIIVSLVVLIFIIHERRKIVRARLAMLDGKFQIDEENDIAKPASGNEDLSSNAKVNKYAYNLKRLFSLKALVPAAPGGGPVPERRVTLTGFNACLAPPNIYTTMNTNAIGKAAGNGITGKNDCEAEAELTEINVRA